MNQLAKDICKSLQEEGFEALLVGGCVRDTLLGEAPNDWDIATNACPEHIRHIFSHRFIVKDVGAAFGVVLLRDPETLEEFEVATFREDQFNGDPDGRRPTSIKLNVTSAEDAARRDFTVNALFLDPVSSTLLDHVNGRKDLELRIIRFVGDPDKRIEEDALRMLRAIRFSLKLGWDMDLSTFMSIRKNAEKISRISAERVTLELEKMLTKASSPRRMLTLLAETGLLKFILPEVLGLRGVSQNPKWHPEGDVFTHTQSVVQELKKESFELQLAAILHDIGKPSTFGVKDNGDITAHGHADVGADMAEGICRRLKLSVDQTERIVWLIRNHMKLHSDPKEMKTSTLRRLVANPFFEDLVKLTRADDLGSNGDTSALDALEARIAQLPPFTEVEQRQLPPPLVNGNDLITKGLKPGPKFKVILDKIQDLQLEGELNTREEALKCLEAILIEEGEI